MIRQNMENPGLCAHYIMVDGQQVVIPTSDGWQAILDTGIFDQVKVFSEETRNSVFKLVSFVAKYSDEFCLGLYSGGQLKRWLVLPLFCLNNDFQRVQIEYSKCDYCSWKGRIANPTEPTLYMGLPNELEVTRRAHALPRLPCPICKSPLPRASIWTESEQKVDCDK